MVIEELYEHVEKIIALLDEHQPQEDLAIVEELAQQMMDELDMITDN